MKMKKLLVLIICATGIVFLEANPAEPATLEVRPPGAIGALGEGDMYPSIQAAIDDAEEGWTVAVHEGVYEGDTVGPDGHLVIDKANLTLKAVDGTDNTFINVANGVGIDIRAGAVNFVLGGADSNGFTITGGADTTFVIQLTNAPSGVEISHNTINTTGNASMGISVGAAGAADLTISNNDFVAESGDGCVWGPRLVDLTVSDNTFDGGSYAIQTSGITSSSPSVISGNVITGFTGSGAIVICNGEETSDLAITGNTITGCTNGIRFAQYCAQGTPGDMTTVTVEDNTLSTNTNGILVGDGENILASNFTIQYNCFNGNTTYGLQNEHATELVTAEKNAWSDPNGPHHPDTNPYASGDEVSDNVDYYAWYPDCNFTTVVYKPVHNVTLDAYYDTIQDAIDDAREGDTITADPVTYGESVTINVNNLTIIGIESSLPAITGGIKLDTNLTGLTLKNFIVSGNAVAGKNSVVRMYGAITDLTVDNCVFDGENVSGRCGFTGGQLEGDVTITDCEFKNILGWAVLDSRSGSGGDGSAMGTVTFADNNIHHCNGSIVFRGLSSDRTDAVNAYGNTWSNIGGNNAEQGQHWAALEINRTVDVNYYDNEVDGVAEGEWGEGQALQLWDIDTLDVHDNTLTNNFQGIYVHGSDPAYGGALAVPGGSIYCNTISGNSEYGISVGPTATGGPLDAEYNWWGDASGPSGEGPGSGDSVSENVDFFPWLLSEDCEDSTQVVADFVVDDDWVGLHDLTRVFVGDTDYYISLNAFDTIQGAVDAASDGNSISVADGNYVGAIVNEDLTIIGANPGGSVITDGPHYGGSHPTAKTAFKLDADSDGTEIKNFTIDCNAADNFYFAIFSRAANDVVVDSLTVNNPVQGITNYGGSNWQIINNVLNYTEAAGGGGIAIYLGAYPPDYTVLNGNIVRGNTITATATAPTFTCPGISMALDLRYGRYGSLTGNEDISYNMIVDNDITGTGAASEVGIEIGVIGLEGDPNKIAATLGLIHDNTVRNNVIDNTDWGIYFYTVTDLRVLGNEIVDCNDGIHMKDGHTGIAINYNAIYGSASYGLNNTGAVVVDAELNWWGDISGPNDPCGTSETDGVTCYEVSVMRNADGFGDKVTQNADYCPWLMAPVSPSDNPYMAGDLNYDGCVDFRDVAILADEWLQGCE